MLRSFISLCFGISLMAFAQVAPQAPQAQQAPQAPQAQQKEFNALASLMASSLVTANGKTVNGADVLKGKKLVALYFSAHWCPPCRAFTPELVKFRNKAVSNNLPFEVVLVSSDNDEKAMKSYMATEAMRWYAVPYSSQLRTRLKSEFKVSGIPTLILLDGNGKVFSKDARWDVAILGENAYQYWKSSSYKPLTYQDYEHKKSVKADIKNDGKKNPKKEAKKEPKKESKKDSKKNTVKIK